VDPTPALLDPRRAAAIAARFAGARVVVLGDLMVDRFLWGSVSRISPEAPVPIVRVERESTSLGGAGNVARNVVALGGEAIPVGLHGEDADGALLTRLFREAGIGVQGLLPVAGRPTTVKTRIVAHHQHVVRFDREEDEAPDGGVVQGLKARAVAALEAASALVVSDYEKGTLSAELLQAVLPEAARRGLPVVVDPKIRLMPHYRPVTVITPNIREAGEAAGTRVRTDPDLEQAGRLLLARLGCPWLLITRGERGMLLLSADGTSLAVPTRAREVFDVSGAGDTVVATLALALAAGAAMPEAAVLSNLAAGVVVGKLGTASLTRPELLEACTLS
jgi:D-beta-D-heptose 7-phosphate kinase/D-beta-D-heptose 1-phosphate adenosyltransferase